METRASEEPERSGPINEDKDSNRIEEQEDVEMLLSRSLEHPRQLFKLHLLDQSNSKELKANLNSFGSGTQERLALKQAAIKRTTSGLRSQSQFSSSSSLNSNSNSNSGDSSKDSTTTTRQISNSNLKKLLNQALISGTNKGSISSSSSSIKQEQESRPNSNPLKSSNFKFSFIKKAPPIHSINSNNNNNNSTSISTNTNNGDSIGNKKQGSSSLAASVSKQLATSLLYSAANLVGNMTNTHASISSLASQLISQQQQQQANNFKDKTNQNKMAKDKGIKEENRNSNTNESIEADGISRAKSNSDKDKSSLSSSLSASIKKVKSGNSDMIKGNILTKKVKKNSKIYNLPVKFVSNGQPLDTIQVFNTLKQHFAAIKRLQASAASNLSVLKNSGTTNRHKGSYSNSNSNSNQTSTSSLLVSALTPIISNSNSNSNKKTKSPSKSTNFDSPIKIKGVNSRLIYLPLKLLANGRPNKISVSRNSSNNTNKSKRFKRSLQFRDLAWKN